MADHDVHRDDIRREDVRREEIYREPPPRGDGGAGSALWFIIGGVIVAALVLLFLFGDFGGTEDATVQVESTETETLTAPMPDGAPDAPAGGAEAPAGGADAPAATEEPAEPAEPAEGAQQ